MVRTVYTIELTRDRNDRFHARLFTKGGDEIADGFGQDSEQAILEMAKQLNSTRREDE